MDSSFWVRIELFVAGGRKGGWGAKKKKKIQADPRGKKFFFGRARKGEGFMASLIHIASNQWTMNENIP